MSYFERRLGAGLAGEPLWGLLQRPAAKKEARPRWEEAPVVRAAAVEGPVTAKVSRKDRGLRQFSIMVCDKLQHRRISTYNQIADDLIQDLRKEGQSSVAKNIRRRVYDALNVLLAVGVISKVPDKKVILWNGLQFNAHADLEQLDMKKQALQSRVHDLEEKLCDAIDRFLSRAAMLRFNKARAGHNKISFPLLVVATPTASQIQCSMNADRTDVTLTCNKPFDLKNQDDLAQRLFGGHEERHTLNGLLPPWAMTLYTQKRDTSKSV